MREIDCSHQRSSVENVVNEEEINSKVLDLWGKDKRQNLRYPKHWSGKDLPLRIPSDVVEMQQTYCEHYPRLSWYVHSGSAGYAGLDEDALRSCFALSHTIAQQAALGSIELAAREMKIMQAVDWLPGAIKLTRLAPGLLLTHQEMEARFAESKKPANR